MRWIVGDIQGCARELELLLAQVRFDPANDELWAAGDIINRGPDSLAAVRLWADVGGRGVIGNHEVYALCARTGTWPRKRDTLDALFAAPDAEALFARLRALPALVHLPGAGLGPDAWLVHAGLHPQWHELHSVAAALDAGAHDDTWLVSDEISFATRVRVCTRDGTRGKFEGAPTGCPPPFFPWDNFYTGTTRVVHGHWAWRGHYRMGVVMGLDSGCVYGGALTAWCQEEDRTVAIPATGGKSWVPT